ncbi:unnamed protein product, partial [Gulo gulo]
EVIVSLGGWRRHGFDRVVGADLGLSSERAFKFGNWERVESYLDRKPRLRSWDIEGAVEGLAQAAVDGRTGQSAPHPSPRAWPLAPRRFDLDAPRCCRPGCPRCPQPFWNS